MLNTALKSKNAMKTLALFAALAIVPGLLAYGALMNYRMHQSIDAALSNSPELREHIGAFQQARIVSSGCEFKLTCNTAFHVSGDTGCIRVLVVTTESFPTYEILSISPETSTRTIRSEGSPPVTTVNIQNCPDRV